MIDDEVRRLRSCIRDLVALSALPAVWVGRSAEDILGGLLDVVRSMLRLELVYVRLALEDEATVLERASGARTDLARQGAAIGRALTGRLTGAEGDVADVVSPLDGRPLRAVSLPFTVGAQPGLLIAADGRRDFPTDTDRLLLSVAVNQGAVALQGARLLADNARLAHEARETNRMKDEFLATLSHELRTPLNAILAWTRLLRSTTLNAATTARGVDTIERNAYTQAQLVEDLLDLSRIVSGKLSVELLPVALPALVDAAVDAVAATADAKRVRLERRVEDTVGLVLGDASRLQQVLGNLLSNAVKFTPSGGRIDVVLQLRGTEAEIVVSDTGQGIEPRFLPEVFDRFRQADASTTRRSTGLGLGLAIVRHLVEAHGGRVFAASEGPGRGAQFTVVLPLAVLDTPVLRAAGLPLSSVAVSLDDLHVLLVDDDVASLDVLALVLRRCGARVTAATSVTEALDVVVSDPPDAVVSDIGMPERDGYALIGELRRVDEVAGRRTPALALTAYAGLANGQRVLAAGFDVHLPKPTDPFRIAHQVRSLVSERRARRQAS